MKANDQDAIPTLPVSRDDMATQLVVHGNEARTEPETVPTARAEPETVPTAPAGEAPTVATFPADQATLPMGTRGLPQTVATAPANAQTLMAGTGHATGTAGTSGDAATLPLGTAPVGAGTGTYSQSQSALTRGGTTRLRTRVNASLSGDQRALDQRLQLSRTSVLADMATTRQARGVQVPGSISKQVELQGTDGRYVVDRFLAEGGMGAVLLIEDHDFRRSAAMKVIKGNHAGNIDAVERFLAEAQVTAQLEHPNIVPVHDLGVLDDGSLFYTMQFIQGTSLGNVVKKLRQHHGELKERDGSVVKPDAESAEVAAKWTEEMLLLTFLKVLDGVGYAHAKGVIHRDLKPDNIMVGAHGQVLVVDWGIAKVTGKADRTSTLVKKVEERIAEVAATPAPTPGPTERLVASVREIGGADMTMAGSAMGTPQFMPPEQATGDLERIDERADVYALGATLYEMLSRRRSVIGATLPELIAKVIKGDIAPLETVAPWLQPDLVAIVKKAMAKDIEARYDHTQAFAEDLRRYLSGKAVTARRRSIGELIRQWVIDHRIQLTLGGSAVVLAVVAVTGGMWWVRSQRLADGMRLLAKVEAALPTLDRADPKAIVGQLDLLDKVKDRLEDAAPPRVEALMNTLYSDHGKAEMAAKAAERRRDAITAARLQLAKAQAARGAFEQKKDAPLLQQAAIAIEDAAALPRGDDTAALAKEIAAERATIEGLKARLAEFERQRVAELAMQEATAQLERLAALDPLTAAADFDAMVGTTAERCRTAAASGIAGAGEAIARLGQLRAEAQRRRAEADRATRAAALAADAATLSGTATKRPEAESALAAKELTAARNLVAQARELQPADQTLQRRERELEQAVTDREQRAARFDGVRSAREALATIPALLAAGEVAKAREKWGIADSAAPNAVKEIRAEVAAALTAIDQRADELGRRDRLAADAAQAGREFAQAQEAFTRLQAVSAELAKADAELAALDARQVAQPLDDQRDRFQVRERALKLRTEVAERWSETEATASGALARLAGQDALPLDAQVRNLLAQVYLLRLKAARRAGALGDVKAFTNLIQRLGPKVTVVLDGEGRIEVRGGGATVQRLASDGSGRLIAAGEPRTAKPGEVLTVASGRWQVTTPAVTVALAVEPDQAVAVELPAKLPAIPGTALRWVPPVTGSAKGFLLADTEVTIAQYLVFLTEPEQFKVIAADVKEIAEKGQLSSQRKIRFLPAQVDSTNYLLYKLEQDADGAVARIGLLAAGDGPCPVSCIDRSDAEAYCRWLGKRQGLTVRLPTKAEWRWAAGAGDELRVYPWGPGFDGMFAVTNWLVKRQGKDNQSQPVGSVASDVGPFGHHDLAGNVREWLADRDGPREGWITGGSYADSRSLDFRNDAQDAMHPGDAFSPIGFRILVEIP